MSKKLTLVERIRAMITREIESALSREIGEETDVANGDSQLRSHTITDRSRRGNGDEDDEMDPGSARTQSRITGGRPFRLVGAQVTYRILRSINKRDRIFPAAEKVYVAIASRKRPPTAKQIEKIARLKRKTVESAIYHLRHAGLIESVPINEREGD